MKVIPITIKNKNNIKKEQVLSVGNNQSIKQMTSDYQKSYMRLLTNSIKNSK